MTRTVPKVQSDGSRTQGLSRLELIRLLLVGKGNKPRNHADHSPELRDLRPVPDGVGRLEALFSIERRNQ
jgi:hypothetical protein